MVVVVSAIVLVGWYESAVNLKRIMLVETLCKKSLFFHKFIFK